MVLPGSDITDSRIVLWEVEWYQGHIQGHHVDGMMKYGPVEGTHR